MKLSLLIFFCFIQQIRAVMTEFEFDPENTQIKPLKQKKNRIQIWLPPPMDPHPQPCLDNILPEALVKWGAYDRQRPEVPSLTTWSVNIFIFLTHYYIIDRIVISLLSKEITFFSARNSNHLTDCCAGNFWMKINKKKFIRKIYFEKRFIFEKTGYFCSENRFIFWLKINRFSE